MYDKLVYSKARWCFAWDNNLPLYYVDRACHNTECVIHSQLHFRQWIHSNILTFDKWFLIDEVRDRILCSLRSLCIDNKYMAYQVVWFVNPQSLFCHLLETLLKLTHRILHKNRYFLTFHLKCHIMYSAYSFWTFCKSESICNEASMQYTLNIEYKTYVWKIRRTHIHFQRERKFNLFLLWL